MSIINDAIKKAEKKSGIKNDGASGINEKMELYPARDVKRHRTKLPIIIIIALTFMGSLLAGRILYRHVSRLAAPNNPSFELSAKKESSAGHKGTNQNNTLLTAKSKELLELNGIVYDIENRWAIVNNRIVKEGDSFLDAKLILIAEDFVKIENNNGEKSILTLR